MKKLLISLLTIIGMFSLCVILGVLFIRAMLELANTIDLFYIDKPYNIIVYCFLYSTGTLFVATLHTKRH